MTGATKTHVLNPPFELSKPQLFNTPLPPPFLRMKNLARRLLEAFRYIALSDKAFDPLHAAGIQIRFDTS